MLSLPMFISRMVHRSDLTPFIFVASLLFEFQTFSKLLFQHNMGWSNQSCLFPPFFNFKFTNTQSPQTTKALYSIEALRELKLITCISLLELTIGRFKF
jgi:hypothetical protein